VTGFDIHRTPRPINKIKHLRVQIAAKSSKKYANTQIRNHDSTSQDSLTDTAASDTEQPT